ncbi:hypothetical protein SH1V18_02160 [Vallitalea longa]|uniref:F5/8 type C domain-containing protein n=1 Tax=Vallitalea longa TaxID=2936439 RepID=A0A9W6DCZ1_9FIRM|nr:DUF4073 domain-containing protein [Vallitalea longa]GKX27736.1 hypothetical protein SH1V18_02160 [Vallitalea longa]
MIKQHKRISILVLVTMIISLLPVNTYNVSANSNTLSLPVATENTEYSELYNQLTTYINEKVVKDTSESALNNYLKDANFEKAIAQREFIRKAGVSTVEEYVDTEEKRNFMNWVLNNTEAMNLFLEGGEPTSSYPKAFDVWFEIFTKDPDSYTGYELKLAIATALRLGNGVQRWYTSRLLVTPYERYEYFKVREAEGVFPISMKTRSVWELRNTVKAPCSNWDLDYVREVIHKDRWSESSQRVRVKYPPYTANSIYKDKNGNPYSVFRASGDQFFGPDATIKEVHEIGGVCGTASKFGTITNNAFGNPGFNVGQPGHAAHVYYSPKSAGKWDLGYNISGWGKSVVGQRTYIPYTNYGDISSNRPAYWFTYEASREDEEALHKSHQLKWIATAITDYNKAQAIRKVAMQINKWNIDVWKDYVNAIKKLWNNAMEDTRIPSENMTATATSSHNSSQGASKVLDGNTKTIWHTRYGSNKAQLPQSITLSFDREYEISRFTYVPRQSGSNGRITEYNLYTSIDGENYELVSHGNWSDNSKTKTVEFEKTNAKHIKLEAIKGHGGFATASELKVYGPFEEKPITIEERYELADYIIDNLKEQPRVAYDLFRSIQNLVLNKETPREKYQEYMVKLNSMLEEAYEINNKQKQIAQEIKNVMSGNGLCLADFNFNGTNAGKLVRSKTDTEYSLDGGVSWKPITEENMKLSDEEIESITAENNIRLRLIGTNEYVTIPIKKAPSLPKIYGNDDMNKIYGLNDKVYFSIDNGETWTRYKDQASLPDLTGDVNFIVKIPGQGKTLRSEIRTFNFTSQVNPLIILPSDMESVKVDVSKITDIQKAFDGNIYSYFHTNYSENGGKMPQSVTIELKEESDIYKLEYVPRQDGNSQGRITEYNIYASNDGENFTIVSKGKWTSDNKIKTSEFNARGAKYIRFEGVKAGRNYIAAAEIRLYKTESLIPHVIFSFDGSNAGRLVGANTNMEYSIDNGSTWKDITEVNMSLTPEDFININPESIIEVRFKNTTESGEISFTACEKLPDVQGDDIENTITGLDETMEYSFDDGETWTTYNGEFNLGLRGNVNIYVRYQATGTTFASDYVALEYTAEETEIFDGRVTYKFISKATGRSLDVTYGSKEDNANIKQYRFTGSSNQTVRLVNITENQYKIVMRNSGKVLVPKDSSTDDGATLAQTTYTGNDIQKWEIVNLGNNEYEIINVATGLALTANSNKSTINISKFVHNKYQVWALNYLNKVVVPEVTFSFDGENAGKIMGSTKSMEYTIDGGQSWKSVSRDNITLTKEELSVIKPEYGIKIRIRGNAGIAAIETKDKPSIADVEADDNKNIVAGIDSSMEYSVNSGKTWTRYSESDPAIFLSDLDVLVRIAGNGVTPPGESQKLSFTSKISTPLYKEFDPMNHITVVDSQGNDISNNIQVIENTVDVNKKGMYSVSYRISDGDNEETIVKEVEVVSDVVYLSDIKYKSGKAGYRSISKDTNIGGGPIILYSKYGKDTFKKGMGAHAYSEIVYDIENKGYTDFRSYIGLNQNVYSTNSSVIYKVYVDGTLKYDSGVIASKTPYRYVDVDIRDAKEIKLVVDPNGSKGNDFSIWADAKFVSKDSAPVIEVTNVAYEKDDEIDFDEIMKNVKATDIEDGDLSSEVTYTTNYTKGSTGNFDIVYSVTDSEGYETDKNVKLIVVNSSIYVSDTDWVSAKSGWSRTKKDLTISSKPLIIWDGEKAVTYEKGIGSHAHSETVYNLEGKDYGYFTSYVGASREGNYRTSVEFKVYVDGELAAETGVMKKDTPQQFIKVNIGGAKKLKLVITDGGNGQGNDSAIWADSKFLIADGIVMAVDTSMLDEVLEEVEKLEETAYEKDSWDRLQGKISFAKSLLQIGGFDQIQVDEALEDIKSAIGELEIFVGESPVINAEDLTFYEGEHIDFDEILSEVTATDKEDGDLSSQVTYTTDYVEDELGEFEVEYNVADSHGNKTTKKVKLEVKIKFIYATDMNWTKATTAWRRVEKDKSNSGGTLRLWDGQKEVTYEKGIGTHAYSQVIYNIEGKDFKYFTSVIGVSQTANYRGSVRFEVYLDNKLVYTSEIMKKKTPCKSITIDVEGAQIIKLVVDDAGNGKGNDHANWADAKFLTTDENLDTVDIYIDEENIPEEETITEDEDSTEGEAITEGEDSIEGEEITKDEESTDSETMTEGEDSREGETITEGEDSTDSEAINEVDSSTQDETITVDKDSTESEAIKNDEDSTENEAIEEDDNSTEDEAIIENGSSSENEDNKKVEQILTENVEKVNNNVISDLEEPKDED